MTQTVNLFKNPSAETNTTGFYVSPGNSGSATLSNPTTGGFTGSRFALATWSVASTANGGGMQIGDRFATGVERIDVVPSTQYTVSVMANPSKAKTLRLAWIVADASGSVQPAVNGSPVVAPAGVWSPVSVSFTTPSTAARLYVLIQDTDGTFWSVGNTLAVDAVMVTATAAPVTYGDPSTNPMWAWSGAVNASTSILFNPSITLTPHLDANPRPRVEVNITDFPPSVKTIDVHRLGDNRDFTVRGLLGAASAGGASTQDVEVPFGIPLEYRAEMFDSSGESIGYTDSAVVTVDCDETWIHNPLDPAGATKFGAFQQTAARDLVRPSDGTVLYPIGRRVGVLVSGERHGLRGVSLDLVADTVEQADRLQAMLGDYNTTRIPVLCISLASSWRVRLPKPLFAAVLEMHEQDWTYEIGGEQIGFAITGDEVSPPTPALFIPLLTNADLKAYYATNAALKADNLTNLAVKSRYDLAGFAS